MLWVVEEEFERSLVNMYPAGILLGPKKAPFNKIGATVHVFLIYDLKV